MASMFAAFRTTRSIERRGWRSLASFGERLRGVFEISGHLCVGIDPHPYLLQEWDLPDSGKGLREFGLRTVDAAAGQVGIVKPQVAFFERHGSAGYDALERTLAAARSAGLVVIADAKRGDVGTSVEAYAQSWLTPGAPLEADAMTVSAFQGVGSLAAPMLLATENGKGLFVLAATSNPESRATQTAVVSSGVNASRTVAASIVADVKRSNQAPLGSFGVVIGATVALSDFGLSDRDLDVTPILAPGFGFQGAGFASLRGTYGTAAANTVVSSSRGILEAGRGGIRAAIAEHSAQLAEAFAQ
jgi:orotidine-5'-phosphate decarboxylase